RSHGEVKITSLASMFKTIRFHTHENIGTGPIHLPEQTLHTTGYWISVDAGLWNALGRETLEAGLQGMAHSLRHVASLRLMCDPRDLGAIAEVRSVTTRLPTVTVYEIYPGGVGYASRMYDLHHQLLEDAAAFVRQDVIPLKVLEPDPGSVAYIDTETTGLSGGSGTLVFAAAVARPVDCGLRVAQVFLPQPGMEAAFLYALNEELQPASAIAS